MTLRNALIWLSGKARLARDRFLEHKLLYVTLLWLLIMPIVACIASFRDNTWSLPRNGKGFFQHYGALAMMATAPLLVSLTVLTVSKFTRTIGSLSTYTVGRKLPQNLRKSIDKHVSSIQFRLTSRYIVLLPMVVGFYSGILNIQATSGDVTEVFGNDVFDSRAHIFGFIAYKSYLLVLWSLVYPVILFQIIHITVSLVSILKSLSERKLLYIDFFHEDNCGGVSVFGAINLRITTLYLLVFLVAYMIRLTHSNDYLSLTLSINGAWILFILQSLANVYYIHRFVRIKKSNYLTKLNGKLNEMLVQEDLSKFPLHLLQLRAHVVSVNTFPYTVAARYTINVIRVLPALFGLFNLLILNESNP